jgi:hypothetical protein
MRASLQANKHLVLCRREVQRIGGQPKYKYTSFAFSAQTIQNKTHSE